MRKKILHGVLCGLGGALVAAALWLGGALERLESTTWAWRVQAMAKPGAATDRIRIILLDQSSLDWGKKEMALPWPWPRRPRPAATWRSSALAQAEKSLRLFEH